MATDMSAYLRFLSRNAAKLARRLGTFSGDPNNIARIAAGRTLDDALSILIQNARSAVARSEYAGTVLGEHLVDVFSDPAMITFTRQGVDIISNAYIIAGGPNDLQEGFDAARSALGVGDRLSPKQASDFWRERIYRPAREGLKQPRMFKKNVGRGQQQPGQPFDYRGYAIGKYGVTVRERVKAWGNMAPYWLFLEYGSSVIGGRGGAPYPPQGATGFVAAAQTKINSLYQTELIRVADEMSGAVNREVELFLRNPQSYEPGQFLRRLETESQAFIISVSPSGELSIRQA